MKNVEKWRMVFLALCRKNLYPKKKKEILNIKFPFSLKLEE